jgi:hypothetical protein
MFKEQCAEVELIARAVGAMAKAALKREIGAEQGGCEREDAASPKCAKWC